MLIWTKIMLKVNKKEPSVRIHMKLQTSITPRKKTKFKKKLFNFKLYAGRAFLWYHSHFPTRKISIGQNWTKKPFEHMWGRNNKKKMSAFLVVLCSRTNVATGKTTQQTKTWLLRYSLRCNNLIFGNMRLRLARWPQRPKFRLKCGYLYNFRYLFSPVFLFKHKMAFILN